MLGLSENMQFGTGSPDFGIAGFVWFFLTLPVFLEYGKTIALWNFPADVRRLRKLTLALSEPVRFLA